MVAKMEINTLIAIFSGVVAFCSAGAAYLTYKATDRQRKINQNLQTFKLLEQNAQIFQKIHECSREIYSSTKHEEFELLSKRLQDIHFDLFNFYETLCYGYNNGTIDKHYFETLWKDTIVARVVAHNELNKLDSKYTEISKVYNKFKK